MSLLRCPWSLPRFKTANIIVVICVAMIIWVFYLVARFSANMMISQGESVKKPLNLCETPSLPRGSVHIVVGTYKYNDPEEGIGFDHDNYLFDLGLTNADIFWYRRVEPEEPLREMEGPCGMRLHERLLLPNYGRVLQSVCYATGLGWDMGQCRVSCEEMRMRQGVLLVHYKEENGRQCKQLDRRYIDLKSKE